MEIEREKGRDGIEGKRRNEKGIREKAEEIRKSILIEENGREG